MRFQFHTTLALPALLMASSSLAQGLYQTTDREYRLELERRQLMDEKQPFYFIGFRPTAFEGLEDPVVNGNYLSLGLNLASFQESPSLLPAFGTPIDHPTHPVYQRDQLEGSQGLNPPYGFNEWATVDASVKPTNWFFFRSILHGGSKAIDKAHPWYHIEQLYTEWRWRSLVLSLGRKPLYWGQSFVDPILLSDNATGFDYIQLATLPQRWPWLFRYLGEMKTEVFFQRMRSNRSPPNDYFVGWRVGTTPGDFLELNAALSYQFGGKGVNTGSTQDQIVEILGARTVHGEGVDDTSEVTNRAADLDFRVNFKDHPWPFSVYGENHLEDCCGFRNLFIKSLSYLYGGFVRLGKDRDANELRLEYVKTCDKIYYHPIWTSGYTNDGRILGHPIGRDAQGVYFKWSKFFGTKDELEAAGFWAERGRRGQVDRLNIRAYRPNFQESEKTFGLTPAWRHEFPNGFSTRISASLLKVLNKENIGGRNPWEPGALGTFQKSF